MKGITISNPADFPNVRVNRDAGRSGRPVFFVGFENKEYGGPLLPTLLALCALAAIIVPFWDDKLLHMADGLWISMGCIIFTVFFAVPRGRWREIHLDFDRGEIRVKRWWWVTLRKPAVLKNLAIEPHPDSFSPKQGKRRSGERQHCLVGYFGKVGADRAILVSRYEWPPMQSLMEVQGAVLWAWEQGVSEFEGRGDAMLPGAPDRSMIAPPLD